MISKPKAENPMSDSTSHGRGSTPDGEFSDNSSHKRGHDEVEDETGFLFGKRPKIEPSSPGNSTSDGRIPVLQALPVTISRPEPRRRCKQFWKVGDYEEGLADDYDTNFVGSDRVRVHPKFLHSNATSHKWALGAAAELLDNSLDEVSNGATYVHVDSTINQRDKTHMLIIEDNGGGMNPTRVRQCMSFGYSGKRKQANTIGQYGNGLKTSTMRLGADAIVFSRCRGNDGRNSTQSIAMLSSTYLRETRQEDIVVPLIDFERIGNKWNETIHTTLDDWNDRLRTIIDWSPYFSRADLLKQFDFLNEQGTRIVIYNLWEDDQERLELDFDTDPYDIQLRGVNRDPKSIEMAKKYPNSRHFLTYRHSLRSYASILYLRLPRSFKIILRGKDVEHHDITDDMMLVQELMYKPVLNPNEAPNKTVVASIKLGFVKDAHNHIDIQGFNVYHKNRLIKPFWRVWNAAGSDGRGVIGVLEANFVEPAHDKQGFERTTVLSRLENRLITYQKSYWSSKCHQIGYAPRRNLRKPEADVEEITPRKKKASSTCCGKSKVEDNKKGSRVVDEPVEVVNSETRGSETLGRNQLFRFPPSKEKQVDRKEGCLVTKARDLAEEKSPDRVPLKRSEETDLANLVTELRREKQSLQTQLDEAKAKNEEMERETIALIDIFQRDRSRRDITENSLRTKLKEASVTIADLIDKVKRLEAARPNT
ncbi:PREDICTED: protein MICRORCHIDIA 5 [Tarenaya hassleriana]|uniref:protein MICRORCHIDIA 5 n=1 Tax=Tarenaya hassleriana TaxID=28532 RepID=UPI00053C99AB|nr:PREDICTED: protein MICRORCHIDIA 5 [Tarenaya hassleriana]